jgi:hypothetical protein
MVSQYFLLFQMAVETMFQLHMAADSDLITLKNNSFLCRRAYA